MATKPARWRREPSLTGLASIGQGPRGYELRRDGETLIFVEPRGGNWNTGPLKGWYWYGFNRNTLAEKLPLWPTAEDAKADAADWFKDQQKGGRP